MYAAKFDYYTASSVDEAIALLGQHKDAKLLAGGHSLLPLMKMRLAQPAALIDIGKIEALNGIRDAGDMFAIGALTTHARIQWSERLGRHCPIMTEAAALIGDMQVRNRGTIGGSLAHADPAADYPPVILALGAEIDAVGPSGKRTIKADDFFTGTLTTALAPDEVLTEVRVPRTDRHGMGAAYKELQHPASHYAVVGVAVWLRMDGDKVADARVGVTGATDHAVRATKMEDALRGNVLDDDLMATASERATEGLECVGDIFASASYRAHLVQVYAKRALEAAHGRVHHMS